MMLSSYLAVDRRAVLAFFNPHKTEHLITNYITTAISLGARDQHSTKCFRSIYLVLFFQSILQVYLYLFPFQWQHTMLFDVFDQSNNYPNLFKLNISALFILSAYMFNMLYVHFSREKSFQLLSDYYLHDSQMFVKTSSAGFKKLVVLILNSFQIFLVIGASYICSEYIAFALRIFGRASLPVWTAWIEFLCMNIFFVSFASAVCLFIAACLTSVLCAVLSVGLLVFRFRQTYQPLSLPCSRLTMHRLVRLAHQNIGTMQYIFSVNQLYGSVLFAFLLANLPSNVMIATFMLQNRFSARQTFLMFGVFLGQLNCLLGTHLLATVFSKNIHRPYKRIQSLNVHVRRCPLRARVRVAIAIQTFHIKHNQYGITYGTGKWAFGLVTMASFAKFILLYGELLMYEYGQERSS